MNNRSRLILAVGIAVIVCAALIAGPALWNGSTTRQVGKPALAADEHSSSANDTPPESPTLYCAFYNFTHSATVVSFYFGVEDSGSASPKFSEIYIEEGDARTSFDEDGGKRPRWVYALDDGTPTITSPDAATKIVLYGLKLGKPGVFWTEAGVRSNDYRNLEGQCRQAHLAKIAGTAER